MIYQITSEKDIERLREKSKNCIVIVGGEPVITNQTLSICKKYFETINFGLETISLDLNTTISDLGPIFSDGSLFNNSTLYNISLVTGKISDNVKTTITHSISNRIGDFFIINVKTDSKDFKKTTWFKLLTSPMTDSRSFFKSRSDHRKIEIPKSFSASINSASQSPYCRFTN